jgi:hypothetical protein
MFGDFDTKYVQKSWVVNISSQMSNFFINRIETWKEKMKFNKVKIFEFSIKFTALKIYV